MCQIAFLSAICQPQDWNIGTLLCDTENIYNKKSWFISLSMFFGTHLSLCILYTWFQFIRLVFLVLYTWFQFIRLVFLVLYTWFQFIRLVFWYYIRGSNLYDSFFRTVIPKKTKKRVV
jgi:hypothetical protein